MCKMLQSVLESFKGLFEFEQAEPRNIIFQHFYRLLKKSSQANRLISLLVVKNREISRSKAETTKAA